MDNPSQPVVHAQEVTWDASTATADERLMTVSALLDSLNDQTDAPRPTTASQSDIEHQNQLVQVRLGVASGLFTALRAKHSPTALHCLRVAMHSSAWGQQLALQNTSRDEIELAALMHDIGKIGVPDNVLMKPGRLTPDEFATIHQHRMIGQQILETCCASKLVLDIVKYSPAWFNGNRPGFDRSGDSIPFGARVISILDAFDSMTTDHVYRRAMSRDEAIAELYRNSGTQFDPILVSQFCDLLSGGQFGLTPELSNHWLRDLSQDSSNSFWQLITQTRPSGQTTMDMLFHQKLLNSMHDGVIFVDTSRRILLWNRAAERLTGIPASNVIQRRWTPRLLGMRGENGNYLTSEDCPIAESLVSCAQTLRRFSIRTRSGKDVSVDAHLFPVLSNDGSLHGATLLLHDASSQITLERRVQTLHQKATRDPLTKIANRAEFDRVLAQFVATHLERQLPCSLIICDVDHFKLVNDTYGHPAGDDVLISFAALLQRSSDPADLVARYGGEEFVMLCADCDNAAAARRADTIRQNLSEMPHSALGNRAITASFGVTEIQAGDTAMTMLRRADRALLQAKSSGRNRVVQLGNGSPPQEQRTRRRGWLDWLPRHDTFSLLDATLVTTIPLIQATKRLHGFISDHHANVLSAEENRLLLEFSTTLPDHQRRTNDRPLALHVALNFSEQPAHVPNGSTNHSTLVRVSIYPARIRERRRNASNEHARQLFASLKTYFSAEECDTPPKSPDEAAKGGLFERLASLFQTNETSR